MNNTLLLFMLCYIYTYIMNLIPVPKLGRAARGVCGRDSW